MATPPNQTLGGEVPPRFAAVAPGGESVRHVLCATWPFAVRRTGHILAHAIGPKPALGMEVVVGYRLQSREEHRGQPAASDRPTARQRLISDLSCPQEAANHARNVDSTFWP